MKRRVWPWALVVLAVNLTLGAWTFGYCVWWLFGKQAPIVASIIGGAVLGEVTVPLAVVLWVLDISGVHLR